MTRAAAASRPDGPPYVSLRGRAEFSRVYRSGVRRRAGEILVISAPGEPGPARVGFVAGRRLGGAVARNRVKRRLRAALAQAGLPEGGDHIVVAESDLRSATFAELVAWLRRGVEATEKEAEK